MGSKKVTSTLNISLATVNLLDTVIDISKEHFFAQKIGTPSPLIRMQYCCIRLG